MTAVQKGDVTSVKNRTGEAGALGHLQPGDRAGPCVPGAAPPAFSLQVPAASTSVKTGTEQVRRGGGGVWARAVCSRWFHLHTRPPARSDHRPPQHRCCRGLDGALDRALPRSSDISVAFPVFPRSLRVLRGGTSFPICVAPCSSPARISLGSGGIVLREPWRASITLVPWSLSHVSESGTPVKRRSTHVSAACRTPPSCASFAGRVRGRPGGVPEGVAD